MIKDSYIKYSVGALLYSPAVNEKVANAIISERFSKPYSVALCLEDTIPDNGVEAAEKQLVETLSILSKEQSKRVFYLPKIFIRVRSSEQLSKLKSKLAEHMDIITGFIFPKYSVDNADLYNAIMAEINSESDHLIYMMPVLESADIVDYLTRQEVLAEIKEKIDSVKEYVLNVRVGGNDFSNEFATRRHYDESIYDILPISHLLGDILTVFSREYVVSGPVWEFFSSDNEEWKQGLRKELKLDKLNGFIGKTVIHPKQIDVVNEALKVSNKDYEDAKKIVNWDTDNSVLVGKSFEGERMNEVKPHMNWAYKTIALADIYGVI